MLGEPFDHLLPAIKRVESDRDVPISAEAQAAVVLDCNRALRVA